ncbi:MAG TPA: hypothetical protein VFL17_15130 [Anaerolineae bacterium]|nr:hypothetical protein [Anaerolineae bacterium]
MKIGVVSDTRDNREGLQMLLDRFLVGGARWLFHCGGLGGAELTLSSVDSTLSLNTLTPITDD